ncbi:MAG: aminoacyl-histidine dipeptidase [Clostridiales bacterium]|nr:aminoacyl-histidine dipeptidase [Clostridiales bacterium]
MNGKGENMKKLLSAVLALVLLLSAAACAFAEAGDEEIIGYVTERFLPLTQVPRPSHHEELISSYLYDWAAGRGFAPVRDGANNIIFDVPATPGMEAKPLVVLQAHMDMVCAAADGVVWDPLSEPVKPVVSDETITADGTSLGADDGIGVAMCLCVADGLIAHGPVRIIITTDEEDGMEGMFALDPVHVADAGYLINLDAEQSDAVIVSTASGVLMDFSAPADTVPAGDFDAAVTITLKGLLGGHSGVEIHKGRLSAVRAMAALLLRLRSGGVSFAVASISGGTAPNAIPSSASAVLAVCAGDLGRVDEICAAWQSDMALAYISADPGLTVITEQSALPAAVLSDSALDDVLSFITCIPDGVHTMSADAAGLVESSSNLGILRCDESGLHAVDMIRSSDPARQEELVTIQSGLAAARGYAVISSKSADPWKFDPDSRLLALARAAYLDMNGEELTVMAIHAGLECGTFAVLNPELDMISMGPDLFDVHTPKETCVLAGIPVTYRLLERVLADID